MDKKYPCHWFFFGLLIWINGNIYFVFKSRCFSIFLREIWRGILTPRRLWSHLDKGFQMSLNKHLHLQARQRKLIICKRWDKGEKTSMVIAALTAN